MTPVRIAMVGCGAIAELGHLPGAAVAPDVEVTVLIDRDEARARAMAETFKKQVLASWNVLKNSRN